MEPIHQGLQPVGNRRKRERPAGRLGRRCSLSGVELGSPRAALGGFLDELKKAQQARAGGEVLGQGVRVDGLEVCIEQGRG